MVNVYISAAEAEKRSPYASNPTTQGYSGNNSSYQPNQSNRPQQQEQQSQQGQQKYIGWESDQQVQEQQQLTYQQQAELDAQQRPGFTDPRAIGDINTQRRAQALSDQGMSYNAALGVVLNQQYQEAQKTPGTRDDLYYLTEGDKWKENIVERGSAYHNLGQDLGVAIPANPYEYQADLAVEALKGDPGKRSEWFSPVSGEMSRYLPGGQGSQEVGWDIAKSRRANPADFTNSVNYLNAAEGKYGPYGQLYGGDKWMQANPKSPSETIRMHGIRLTEQQATDIDWAAGAGKQQANALFQEQDKEIQNNPTWLPAGTSINGEFGLVPKSTIPRGIQYQQNIRSSVQMFSRGDFGGAVSEINTALTQFTYVAPDVKGMGKDFRTYASQPGFGNIETPWGVVKTPTASLVTGIGEGGEGMYSDVRTNPLTYVALYELPLVFKEAEIGVGNVVAGAAKSGWPVVGTLGRAGSTPAAITWGNIAKTAMGAYFVGGAGYNIYTAPEGERNKVVGITAGQFMAIGAGLPQAAAYTPKVAANPFESRTFFSGERKLPLSEKVMIKAGDFVTGLSKSKGQKVAIQAISTEYNKNLFTKPEITNVEPNYADLTHVGPKNAAAVKAAMVDQPSVLYGSGTVKAQTNPNTPMGKLLFEKAGTSADADIFAEFPDIMEAKAGKAAAVGMDVHTFTPGYPDVGQGTNAPIEPGSYLFGNRYRINPYIDEVTQAGKTPGYKGDTSFEHLNVGFRKYSSAMRDDILDPMNKGYRLGKDLSRGTRSRDYLNEIEQGRKPSAIGQSSAFDEMLKQEITYNAQSTKSGNPNIITETLGEARARYEGSPKQNIPETFSKYTKGAVSSLVSAIAPSSFIVSIGKSLSPSSLSKSSGSSYRPSTPSSSPSPHPSYTPTLFRVPNSPSSRPPTSPTFPGSTSPRSPPSSTPYSPPISPPYSPPYSPPPSSPPRSPPSSVPYTPPYTPPPTTPFGGFPSGIEGSGGRQYMNRGEYGWSNLNPTATMDYLSKGLGNAFDSAGGSFGAKCRHTNAKLKKKCSRFKRNG